MVDTLSSVWADLANIRIPDGKGGNSHLLPAGISPEEKDAVAKTLTKLVEIAG